MVCTYRTNNGRFAETQFKEAVQTCGQHISYCGEGSHHKNSIVELRIKELTLGSCTPLLHDTRLLLETVSATMCTFPFKTEFQTYNNLEIDKNVIAMDQNFSGVEF